MKEDVMKEYILDRFEGDVAVLELGGGEFMDVDKSLIDFFAQEGDVLLFDGERYFIDHQKTDERKKEMRAKFESLIRREEE